MVLGMGLNHKSDILRQSSLREGIPMLTWAVPPISCYKTVVVGVVSQLMEVKTLWFYCCTMLYPLTPTAPCSLLLLPFVSVTLTFQFSSDVICNTPSSTSYGCSPKWVGYVYYNILCIYIIIYCIYIYIYICKYYIYTQIYIYIYIIHIICIYSLVPGPRTAQTRIRLVKLVNSVTKFRRGIDKFH